MHLFLQLIVFFLSHTQEYSTYDGRWGYGVGNNRKPLTPHRLLQTVTKGWHSAVSI